jgi:hypothetical protein
MKRLQPADRRPALLPPNRLTVLNSGALVERGRCERTQRLRIRQQKAVPAVPGDDKRSRIRLKQQKSKRRESSEVPGDRIRRRVKERSPAEQIRNQYSATGESLPRNYEPPRVSIEDAGCEAVLIDADPCPSPGRIHRREISHAAGFPNAGHPCTRP